MDSQFITDTPYTVYWIGSDGMPYHRVGDVVYGGKDAYTSLYIAKKAGNTVELIDDPNPGNPGSQATTSTSRTSGNTSGGGTDNAEAKRRAEEEAERGRLRGEITGYADDVESVYGGLFGDLNNLVTARDAELETQYGGQLKKASDQFTEALPMIDQSYAAIGSYDSTQRNDSRGKAKKGFEETTQTIATNKGKDKAALGQYKREQEAKFTADRDAAREAISKAGSTTDIAALRGMSNDLGTNVRTAGVTKATLTSEEGGRKAVTDLTGDNGRFDAAINALDSIIKSSMGSDVKAAAVKAVTDSAGLTDEEKKKVQAQYGNVYEEQAAL